MRGKPDCRDLVQCYPPRPLLSRQKINRAIFGSDSPEGTVYLRVWIHSANGATVTGYLDELAVAPAN